MIPVPSGVRVWLATGHTDMRKGFASLSLQVQEVLRRDPLSGQLFCFRGRRGDLLKVIWHDGQGACLFTKRLERGRFLWPSATEVLPGRADRGVTGRFLNSRGDGARRASRGPCVTVRSRRWARRARRSWLWVCGVRKVNFGSRQLPGRWGGSARFACGAMASAPLLGAPWVAAVTGATAWTPLAPGPPGSPGRRSTPPPKRQMDVMGTRLGSRRNNPSDTFKNTKKNGRQKKRVVKITY